MVVLQRPSLPQVRGADGGEACLNSSLNRAQFKWSNKDRIVLRFWALTNLKTLTSSIVTKETNDRSEPAFAHDQ